MGRDAFNRSPAPRLTLSPLPKRVAGVTARPARVKAPSWLQQCSQNTWQGHSLKAAFILEGKEGGTEVPNSTPY